MSDTADNQDQGQMRADQHLADAILPLIRRKKNRDIAKQPEPAPSKKEMQHLLEAAEEANVSQDELIGRLGRVVDQLAEMPDENPPQLP